MRLVSHLAPPPEATRLAQSHRPLTFQERGVTAPFISPMLIGTRIRPSVRGGAELVVPNPSGRRGVYIAPWDDIQDLCRPTVHDTVLYRKLGQLTRLTPDAVRLTGWDVAAEGLAGAAARKAANAAVATDEAEYLLADFLLLLTLIEEVHPTGLTISTQTERTPALEERARQLLAGIATELGRTRLDLFGELESLGRLFGPIGVERVESRARLPVLLARVRALATGVRAWAGKLNDTGDAGIAHVVADAAERVAGAAAAVLSHIHDLFGDMHGLLRLWQRHPDGITEQTGRLAWVLDGWEPICLLWEIPAATPDRGTALRDMARLVPPLPRQVADWAGRDFGADAPDPAARVFARAETPGTAMTILSRNERLRAACR